MKQSTLLAALLATALPASAFAARVTHVSADNDDVVHIVAPAPTSAPAVAAKDAANTVTSAAAKSNTRAKVAPVAAPKKN